jgi:hypothetical protein
VKLVYVAGPYRADTAIEIKRNIAAAEAAGQLVAELSDQLFPIIPHKNTEHWEGIRPSWWFIEGTKEVMRKCHALLVVPGSDWEDSEGTVGEIAEAGRLGIPVFYTLKGLGIWLGSTHTHHPHI